MVCFSCTRCVPSLTHFYRKSRYFDLMHMLIIVHAHQHQRILYRVCVRKFSVYFEITDTCTQASHSQPTLSILVYNWASNRKKWIYRDYCIVSCVFFCCWLVRCNWHENIEEKKRETFKQTPYISYIIFAVGIIRFTFDCIYEGKKISHKQKEVHTHKCVHIQVNVTVLNRQKRSVMAIVT